MGGAGGCNGRNAEMPWLILPYVQPDTGWNKSSLDLF